MVGPPNCGSSLDVIQNQSRTNGPNTGVIRTSIQHPVLSGGFVQSFFRLLQQFLVKFFVQHILLRPSLFITLLCSGHINKKVQLKDIFLSPHEVLVLTIQQKFLETSSTDSMWCSYPNLGPSEVDYFGNCVVTMLGITLDTESNKSKIKTSIHRKKTRLKAE